MLRTVTAMVFLLAVLPPSDAHVAPSRRLPTAAEVTEARARIDAALRQAEAGTLKPELDKDIRRMPEQARSAVQDATAPALGGFKLPDEDASIERRRAFAAAKALEDFAAAPSERVSTSLLAFVSLGMPDHEIRAIVAEARALQARVVIRGLYHDDFRATFDRVRQLGLDGGVDIDPMLFRVFGVTAVPTYVLALGSVTSAAAAPPHVKAEGSVTLGYFLEIAHDTQSREIAEYARRWANKTNSR
jgi:type-F conjugative transfer system pilin assembly protein TrbC